MSRKKEINTNLLLNGLLYIIIGVLLCVFKDSILNWIFTIAGALFIIIGIINLTHDDAVSGIINLAIGALLICGAWLFLQAILIIGGAFIFVKSILALLSNHGKHSKNEVAINVFTAIVGLALMLATWIALDWFFIVVGALFIVDGIVDSVYAMK